MGHRRGANQPRETHAQQGADTHEGGGGRGPPAPDPPWSSGRRARWTRAPFGIRGEGLEAEGEIASRLEPFLGLLLEAVTNDPLEPCRSRPSARGDLGWLFLEDGAHRLRGRISPEGALRREHFVQDCAETEDIGAVINGLAPHLFRGHVAHRAHHRARVRVAGHGRRIGVVSRPGGRSLPRQAEVEDLDATVLRDEDVVRLEVPMDDPLVVGGREAAGDLQRIFDGLARGERSSGQARAERLAIEQLHDRVCGLALLPEVVDGQDVWMGERGHGLGLALEAREGLGIVREVGREHLDGNLSAELLVAGAVDLAHATRAEQGEDLVRTEGGSRSEGH